MALEAEFQPETDDPVAEASSADLAETTERYRALRPRLDDFRLAFHGLVVSLLSKAGIKVQHVESRCKSVEGFAEKHRRKGYRDAFIQMTDVVGIRIIVYYQDHVALAARLIEHEFAVDRDNSSGQRVPAAPGEFGYRSHHLVVSLDNRRALLPEWADHASQKVEIQIRSVLDHAWAEIEHELFYERRKRGDLVDPHLFRKFSRLMAMLEDVDEGFAIVRGMLDEANVFREEGLRPVRRDDSDDGEPKPLRET